MNKYDEIVAIVESKMICSAHNLDHIFRVRDLSLLIAESEEGVDLDILVPAALLHDIARDLENEDKSGKTDHAELGGQMAEELLRNIAYDESKIGEIKACIRSHRFRSGNEPKTLEAKILYDADKLDIIGAVGIARSFILAGQFGQSIDIEEDIEDYIKRNTTENGRILDDSKHTPFIEYELSLKRIPARLHTEKAKEIGASRIKYMEEYFNRLKLEIGGQL